MRCLDVCPTHVGHSRCALASQVQPHAAYPHAAEFREESDKVQFIAVKYVHAAGSIAAHGIDMAFAVIKGDEAPHARR